MYVCIIHTYKYCVDASLSVSAKGHGRDPCKSYMNTCIYACMHTCNIVLMHLLASAKSSSCCVHDPACGMCALYWWALLFYVVQPHMMHHVCVRACIMYVSEHASCMCQSMHHVCVRACIMYVSERASCMCQSMHHVCVRACIQAICILFSSKMIMIMCPKSK